MSLYLSDWRIDAFALASLTSFVITVWMIVVVRRYVHIARGKSLTHMENVSLTLTHQGDWFRLVQQCGWLVFWALIITRAMPMFWEIAVIFAVIEHTIPVHSLLLIYTLRGPLHRVPDVPKGGS